MGGGRYGSAWNGQKMAKFGDPPWRPLPRSPTRSWHVQRRLSMKFHCQGRRVARNVSHGQNPFGLKTGQNDPIRGPQILGNCFYGFGDENECFGVRVLFGMQN